MKFGPGFLQKRNQLKYNLLPKKINLIIMSLVKQVRKYLTWIIVNNQTH